MTNTAEKTSTDSPGARAGIPVDEVIAAARDLAHGGRWRRAASLLDAATAPGAQGRALLALAAAEVAVQGDWFGGTSAAAGRLSTAEEVCATADLDPGIRWDLAFLRLRHEYGDQVLSAGRFGPGPEGKDLDVLADLRRRAGDLREQAPDEVRRGWAEMYLGLIADNLYGDRDAAPAHYEAALRAGESGDDLLTREALRHLGDHDHDRGDHQLALERWGRATALGARAGAVPGTLSQQMLLAVLARDTGDEAGAAMLAREIARWAAALGAVTIEAQAAGFLAGADPTAPPENDS
jgi:tetratricopeptide (TPR) repeat protein